MKIIITGLPPKEFVTEISSHLNIQESPSVVQQRAAEPQSVIQIVGSIIEWLDPFKVAVLAFIAELSKEAAKDVYKNKSEILKALGQATVKPLKAFVELIFRNKDKIENEKIHIIVSLNIPDDYLGTNLHLQISSEEELVWQFANFIIRLNKIEAFILQAMKSDKPPFAPISLIVNEDGTIIVKYMDSVDLQLQEVTIE